MVEGDDEVALGHDRRDPAHDEGHGQRPDEGIDPEPGDDDPVREADGQADRQAGQDRRRARETAVAVWSDTAAASP